MSLSEALDILRGMITDQGSVLALRPITDASYGPFPFFLDDAEITVTFDGGVIECVEGIRVGRRYSNGHDWDEDLLNLLGPAQVDALEAVLRSRATPVSGSTGS